jgi:hypothetical protein
MNVMDVLENRSLYNFRSNFQIYIHRHRISQQLIDKFKTVEKRYLITGMIGKRWIDKYPLSSQKPNY